MSGFTTPYENLVLDYFWGGVALPAPTIWYFGLFRVLPAEDGTGGSEVAWVGYARQAITNSLAHLPAASAGSKTVAAVIDFGLAGSGPTAVTGIGWWDDPAAGTLWAFAPLTSPITVPFGQDVSISPANLRLTLD